MTFPDPHRTHNHRIRSCIDNPMCKLFVYMVFYDIVKLLKNTYINIILWL